MTKATATKKARRLSYERGEIFHVVPSGDWDNGEFYAVSDDELDRDNYAGQFYGRPVLTVD